MDQAAESDCYTLYRAPAILHRVIANIRNLQPALGSYWFRVDTNACSADPLRQIAIQPTGISVDGDAISPLWVIDTLVKIEGEVYKGILTVHADASGTPLETAQLSCFALTPSIVT